MGIVDKTFQYYARIGVNRVINGLMHIIVRNDMDTKDEVFVHFSGVDVPEGVFKALYEGEYVSYNESTDREGKKVAIDVTGVKGGPLLCQNETKRVYLVTKDENGNAPLRLGRRGDTRGDTRGNTRGDTRGNTRGDTRGAPRGQRRQRYEKREDAPVEDAPVEDAPVEDAE